MYNCDSCDKTVNSSLRSVIQYRDKYYPPRLCANLVKDKKLQALYKKQGRACHETKEIKRDREVKLFWLSDPGGWGQEIAREIKVCDCCN